VRSIALEKKLVSVSADLSPDRRIHSSGVNILMESGDLIHAANLDMLNAYPWRYT
jgi:hypothetical protein